MERCGNVGKKISVEKNRKFIYATDAHKMHCSHEIQFSPLSGWEKERQKENRKERLWKDNNGWRRKKYDERETAKSTASEQGKSCTIRSIHNLNGIKGVSVKSYPWKCNILYVYRRFMASSHTHTYTYTLTNTQSYMHEKCEWNTLTQHATILISS